MMTSGLPVGSGCRVRTLEIGGLIDMGKTGKTFSLDRSSNGYMTRRDLGDWLPCYKRGSLIRRIRIWAAGRVLQLVGSKTCLDEDSSN